MASAELREPFGLARNLEVWARAKCNSGFTADSLPTFSFDVETIPRLYFTFERARCRFRFVHSTAPSRLKRTYLPYAALQCLGTSATGRLNASMRVTEPIMLQPFIDQRCSPTGSGVAGHLARSQRNVPSYRDSSGDRSFMVSNILDIARFSAILLTSPGRNSDSLPCHPPSVSTTHALLSSSIITL